MKKRKLQLIVSLFLLLFIWKCYNSETIIDSVVKEDTSPEISIHDLKQHIIFLASDSLKWRKPGTDGGRIAAEYVAKEISNIGLSPIENNSFQYFDVVTSISAGGNNTFRFKDFNGEAEMDFTPLSFSENGDVTAPVIFAGYGFDVKTDSISWNDYSGLDVTGKWVMVLRGDPEDNPHGIFSEHSSLRKKTLVARDHGAAGILFLSGPEFEETDELIPLVYDQSQSGSAIHAIHIKRSVADRIIKESGYTISQLEQRLISDRKPVSFIVQEEITASTDLVKQTVTTQNVAGILYGSDPRLKEEIIVIGAHYDHLGFGGAHSGSRRPDTLAIHNGADDNASGVAAILEIIEKLKEEQTKLKRSVLFLSFGAEEMGLLGSKYFVNNPSVDLGKIKLMFNLDMVGRLDSTTKTITVGGTGTAVGLSDLVQRLAEGKDLNVKLSSEGYGPSDHTSFYVENIPVLFFFTGVHEDYHTPEDDVEKINLSGEKLVAEFVHDLIIEAANVPESLVYQEAGPKEQPSGRRRFKVTLGIMPDYASEGGEGLRVDGVLNNKPAKRSGMEKGDVIVAMDGKPVKNIYDYMYRLEECKPGQRVNVDVLRNGKKITLVVEL